MWDVQPSWPLGRRPRSIRLCWQRQATIQWDDGGQKPTAEVASPRADFFYGQRRCKSPGNMGISPISPAKMRIETAEKGIKPSNMRIEPSKIWILCEI